jgi:tetratricopeptide (TPR) repeat protein
MGLFQTGLSFLDSGDYARAKLLFLKAYKIMPERPSILANLSATLIQLKEWGEALNICKELLKIDPLDSIGWLNLGVCAAHKGDSDLAIDCFTRCLEIDPNSIAAWSNKGHAHQEREEFEIADLSYQKALKLNPDYEDALIGKGNLLNECKHYDEALRWFDKAITTNSSNHLAKWNKALSLLRLENFEDGWPLFESRWHIPGMMEHKPTLAAPLWLGKESLEGKTIYIYAEQGFGDTIQFSRYLPLLEKEKGLKVIFGTPKLLVPLMKSLSSTIKVMDQITFSEKLEQIDFQCPIMSLALAFGTTLDSIPTFTAYLNADPIKKATWAKKLEILEAKPKSLRVGVTWRGSGKYANKISEKRNIPFSHIADLVSELASDAIEFHAIQTEFGSDTDFQAPSIDGLSTHANELTDFSDTAAVVAQLDLVLSVDTACAHLAGALGIPTLMLVPDPPDFMSLTTGDISPWYLNTTLLRQDKRGNWGKPLAEAKEKILSMLKNRSSGKSDCLN